MGKHGSLRRTMPNCSASFVGLLMEHHNGLLAPVVACVGAPEVAVGAGLWPPAGGAAGARLAARRLWSFGVLFVIFERVACLYAEL